MNFILAVVPPELRTTKWKPRSLFTKWPWGISTECSLGDPNRPTTITFPEDTRLNHFIITNLYTGEVVEIDERI